MAENEAGAVITSVETTDADGDTVTVTVDDDRFEVSDGNLTLKENHALDHEATPSLDVTITASDGELSTTAEVTISVTDEDETLVIHGVMVEGQRHQVYLLPAASEPLREGLVRIINHSSWAGEVRIYPSDDSGRRFDALTLEMDANRTIHLSSMDLESGNPDQGLAGGAGAGQGDWRLELTSDLDIDVLSYVRASDGFLATVHDVAPGTGILHRVVTFNPASNRDQISRLRLINAGNAEAVVTVRGTDDAGMPGQNEVRLRIGAGAARSVTAQELESGGADIEGMLGNGSGKWRLAVESDRPIVAMNLLESSLGRLANLSTAPRPHNGVHRVPLFLAAGDMMSHEGLVRVVNRSPTSGEVRIEASDNTDMDRQPVTLAIGANEAVDFNSEDLEQGGRKGLSTGTGSGEGDWRLELTSDLEIEVLAYVRASDGFLMPVHDVAPSTGNVYRVLTFNPDDDPDQVSRLRLINDGEEPAAVTIKGIDERGESPGEAVEVMVSAGAAQELEAAELGLGDGSGMWQLVVESVEPLTVMSLMEGPTGLLANLSTTRPRVDPVLTEDHFDETTLGNAEGIDVSVVDGQGFEQGDHGQRITDVFLDNTDNASLVQIGGTCAYELHDVVLRGPNMCGYIRHVLKHDAGIFWTATDHSPLYSPGQRDWFVRNGRPFIKTAPSFARWLRQANVLMITSLENATCAYSADDLCDISVYCDDFDSSASEQDGWVPPCGEIDDYVAHSSEGLDKMVFVGAIDRTDTASGAIRAHGVFAPHAIYVESPNGTTSQATPVLAAYATNLAFSNPKWGAARIKRELMELAREETIDYRPGAIDSNNRSVIERRVVKVIRPEFAPTRR
ncbi:MAG: hypothetical protein F4013_10760 [Gammaproteobacteria bacterium]|nr:hypothetical protein [Gammaproteobacteria bacterium]MYL02150.1 hypothetical protein [Gammaproteobacteria bacterium]